MSRRRIVDRELAACCAQPRMGLENGKHKQSQLGCIETRTSITDLWCCALQAKEDQKCIKAAGLAAAVLIRRSSLLRRSSLACNRITSFMRFSALDTRCCRLQHGCSSLKRCGFEKTLNSFRFPASRFGHLIDTASYNIMCAPTMNISMHPWCSATVESSICFVHALPPLGIADVEG